MAYRSTSSSTSNVAGGNNAAGFSLPSVISRSGGGVGMGSGMGAVGSMGLSSSSSSSLLSAFNTHSQSAVGSAGGRNSSNLGTIGSGSIAGAGLGGNSNQAQAAFLNAGPNRTVSNVGAQAAQGGMGGASGTIGGYGSPKVSHSGSGPGLADLNLDPSDFPALGSGNVSSSGAAMTPGTSLLSSYATQAGAGSAGTSGNLQPFFSNSSNSSTQPTPSTASFLNPHQQRELNADDFPALGIPSDPNHHHQTNGYSTNGHQVNRGNQEQASAAAALAHRQNLLGSMSAGAQNQARSVANAAASTVFQDEAHLQKKNYANKLSQQTSLSPYPVNSPLPPQANAHSPASQQSPYQANSMRNDNSQASEQQTLATSPGGTSVSSVSVTGQRTGNLPPQLSNMLLQQHLASQRQQAHQHHPPTPLPQTPAQQVLFSPADRFGLLGLLNIIKLSADPDFGMLTLGTDLEKLGLDLGSNNSLHSTFVTPWADAEQLSAVVIEPEYQLPSCYNVQPPPASSKIGAFSDETLFFIFYSQPRDAMQEAAAEQLYKRNWRYHKDLHLWLTKDVGSEPSQKTATYERGSYIFFDPNTWEKVQKEFVLVFEHLETRHRGTGAALQQQQQQLPSQNQQYSGLPGIPA